MKRLIVVIVALMGVTGWAFAGVVGSSHDLSAASDQGADAQVCVYCHTPHQASGANTQQPLWNHGPFTPAADYGTYTSDTLDATDVTNIGGGTMGGLTTSALCMSCHDGTVSRTAMFNTPNGETITDAGVLTGSTSMGTDLSDDHPINFTYDTGLSGDDGGLVDPLVDESGIAPLPLFGGTLQCATCHDAHDNTYLAFLRVTQGDSAICTTCHNK